jgi:hypothetical protein
LSPNAAKDARGNIIFDDPKTRAVLVMKNGRFEAIPRFLRIHVQFEKDPARSELTGFQIKDAQGQSVGVLHWTSVGKQWVEKGKFVKREGEAVLVFERDSYESNPNAMWTGAQGLRLTGVAHEEAMTGKKAAPPAITVLGDAKAATPSLPGEGPGGKAKPKQTQDMRSNEEAAGKLLAKAKELFEEGKATQAKAYLRGVIREHPKTKAAQEAAKLLGDDDKKKR